MSKRLTLLLRYGVSVALIGYLLSQTNLTELRDALTQVRVEYLALALALALIHRLATIFKWNCLLRAKGYAIPYLRLAWLWFVNHFAGLFLPATVGEDIAKTVSLGRYIANTTEAAASIVVDRVIGLFTLLVIAMASSLAAAALFDAGTLPYVVALVLACAVGFGISLTSRATRSLVAATLDRLGLAKVTLRLSAFYASVMVYQKKGSTLAAVTILAFGLQCLRVIVVYVIGAALGIEVPLLYYFIFVPLVFLLTMLPISVGGIGVREGTYVYFFAQIGIATHSALLLSILSYGTNLLAALPGGVIYAVAGLPAPQRTNDSRGS